MPLKPTVAGWLGLSSSLQTVTIKQPLINVEKEDGFKLDYRGVINVYYECTMYDKLMNLQANNKKCISPYKSE